jgi:hypothetical protein
VKQLLQADALLAESAHDACDDEGARLCSHLNDCTAPPSSTTPTATSTPLHSVVWCWRAATGNRMPLTIATDHTAHQK